jgi:hypothetical protein
VESRVKFEKISFDKLPVEVQKSVKKRLKENAKVFEVETCFIDNRTSSYTVCAADDFELFEFYFHGTETKPLVSRVSISTVIRAVQNVPHITQQLKCKGVIE